MTKTNVCFSFEEAPANSKHTNVKNHIKLISDESGIPSAKSTQGHIALSDFVSAMMANQSLVFDFEEVEDLSQSEAHAIFWSICRLAWAKEDKIFIKNANSNIQKLLTFFEEYALQS